MSLRSPIAIVHPVIHLIWMGESLVLLPRSSLQSARASEKIRSDSFRKAFAPRPILLFQKMRGWLRVYPDQRTFSEPVSMPQTCPDIKDANHQKERAARRRPFNK